MALQVHGPSASLEDGDVRAYLNSPGLAILKIGPVEVFARAPEEVDAIIAAATEAKRLLEAEREAVSHCATCGHQRGDHAAEPNPDALLDCAFCGCAHFTTEPERVPWPVGFCGHPVDPAEFAQGQTRCAGCRGADCLCGHPRAGHVFSGDVCVVPECPCPGYRTEPVRVTLKPAESIETGTPLAVVEDEPDICESVYMAPGIDYYCSLDAGHAGLHSQLTTTGAFLAEWGYEDGHVHTISGHYAASVTQ